MRPNICTPRVEVEVRVDDDRDATHELLRERVRVPLLAVLFDRRRPFPAEIGSDSAATRVRSRICRLQPPCGWLPSRRAASASLVPTRVPAGVWKVAAPVLSGYHHPRQLAHALSVRTRPIGSSAATGSAD
jgi:hypothetical protein